MRLYYDIVLHIVFRMAEDKHLTEAAASNLSPGQLLSLFKMEPKTLGVSRRQMFAPEQMSQQFWGCLLPLFQLSRRTAKPLCPSEDGLTLQYPSDSCNCGPSDLKLRCQ